ncbi:MAG: sulfatase [Acidobacteriota bacterium]
MGTPLLTRAVLLALLAASPLGCRTSPPAPSFILISVDTLRADQVGCYGARRDITPRLDRLSRQGTFFKTVVSTSSWTLPAHMSMLTGQLASIHGVNRDSVALDPERPFLPEILHDAGYDTAGFVSGPFVDARYGFSRGFDTYRNFWGAEEQVLEKGKLREGPGGVLRRLHQQAIRASHQDHTGPEVTAAATRWLANHRGHPFFLFIHLWEPHYDYIPPPPFDRRFIPPGYTGSLPINDYVYNPRINPRMAPEDLAYVISQYDGEIAFTDFLIGKILDQVEALGLAGGTLLMVTSDHGEEFFEHGRKGHRKTLYDESLRVPLVVRGPGVAARPEGIDTQVSLIDLAPTLLGATGLPRPGDMMGENLWPLLERGQRPVDPGGAAGDLPAPPPGAMMRPAPFAVSSLEGAPRPGGPCSIFSLRTPRWKAIFTCADGVEVYDLARDPGEQRPGLPRAAGGAADILRQARTIRASLHELARTLPRQGRDRVILDQALKKRLRALGYLK